MAEKVTTMVLKVDLKCSKCYNKVKKVLCKFPEIRDQVYDEKQNTVTIKVVYCCPERMKEKIRSKGGKSIQSIEIKPPEKPKPKEPEKKKDSEKPKESEKKEAEKPKETEKKKDAEKPKETEKKKEQDKPKVVFVDPPPKSKPQQQPKASEPTAAALMAPAPVSVPGYPPWYPNYQVGWCYDGRGGEEASQQIWYGGPQYYGGYYGRPVYDSWGGGGGGYGNRSRGDYFCEENPSTCSIM